MEKTTNQIVRTQEENPDGSPVASDVLDRDATVSGMSETGDASGSEVDSASTPRNEKRGIRWFRGFTGSLTAGLVIIALLEVGTQGLAMMKDVPGPGLSSVLGHTIAAVFAIVAQWFLDRPAVYRRTWLASAIGLFVVADAFALLMLYWWR